MLGLLNFLLDVLNSGTERLIEEFGLEQVFDAEIEQVSLHVFCVQVDHYRAWVSKFDYEPLDCYYADDMEVLWT